MKRSIIVAASCILFLILRQGTAYTFGVGAYGSYSYGMVKYFYHDPATTRTVRNISMGERIGFGLVFDTAVAQDRLVHYRLHIGFGFMNRSFSWKTYSMYEFAMHHTFGFGIIRTESLRFWIGPEIGYGTGVDRRDKDNLEAFGTVGLTVGLNINIGRYLTFFAECNGRIGLYAGENAYLRHIYGSGYEGTCRGGVMYRFDDLYRYEEEF